MASENKFAVLIDADNISEKYIKLILDEASNEGIATYKRIYGDWTTPNLNPWKAALLDNSILPIQQFGYTSRKNSTDSAMIIDAMDIFYSGQVDGFYLVSSDSDFTRLAARLREGGMIVIGMGNRQTPKPFISACTRFKYLDILSVNDARETAGPVADHNQTAKTDNESQASATTAKASAASAAGAASAAPAAPPNVSAAHLPTIQTAIRAIISENSDDEGWLQLSELGNHLVKRYPDFDVRNFGFPRLIIFVKSQDYLETKNVKNQDNNGKQIYLRIKAPAASPKRKKSKGTV